MDFIKTLPQLRLVTRFLKNRDKPRYSLEDVRQHLIFPEINDILDRLVGLTGDWNPVGFLEPVNANSEKTRFLADFKAGRVPANPHFRYIFCSGPLEFLFGRIVASWRIRRLERTRRQLLALRQEIKQLSWQVKKTGGTGWHIRRTGCALALLKVKDDLSSVELQLGILTKDDRRTAAAVQAKYGQLDPALLDIAKRLFQKLREKAAVPKTDAPTATPAATPLFSAEEREFLKENIWNAQAVADSYRWALKHYGLLAEQPGDVGYRVEISDAVTSIDVRDKWPGGPTVLVPRSIDDAGGKKSGRALLSLLAHEVGSHVLQSMNGWRLFRLGGGALKIDMEELYEGLAKTRDSEFAVEYFGQASDTPLPYYAMAIDLASRGGDFSYVFRRVYRWRLLANPSETEDKRLSESWRITLRVFRGSTDAANAVGYACTKDKIYLSGWLAQQQMDATGLGYYNQAAVMADGGLRLLARVDLQESDLPYHFNMDLVKQYFDEVLRPQMAAK